MKPSIGKKTQDYLNSLKQAQDEPQYYYNKPGTIDQLIYQRGLRIKHIYFDKELDLMLVLNNRKVIKRSISDFGVWPKLNPDS